MAEYILRNRLRVAKQLNVKKSKWQLSDYHRSERHINCSRETFIVRKIGDKVK